MTRQSFNTKLAQALIGCSVYYQAPPQGMLQLPCAFYNIINDSSFKADNTNYFGFNVYEVTVCTSNPDTSYREELVGAFEYIEIGARSSSNHVNNFVYTITY